MDDCGIYVNFYHEYNFTHSFQFLVHSTYVCRIVADVAGPMAGHICHTSGPINQISSIYHDPLGLLVGVAIKSVISS